MAEQTITHETMISGLNDVRFPADAPGGLFAEVAAAAGLGLTFALLISLIMRWFVRPRLRAAARPTLQEQIAAATALPHEAQLIALLGLAKVHAPDVMAQSQDQLYVSGGLPTNTALAALLRKVALRDA